MKKLNNKSKTGQKLTQEEIDEMMRLYIEYQGNVERVSKACGRHHQTIKKYSRLYGWDEKLKKLREELTEEKIRQIKNENLKILRALKGQLIQQLKEDKVRFSNIDSAIDRLIRLEMFLLGEEDQRNDNKGEIVIKVEKEVIMKENKDEN